MEQTKLRPVYILSAMIAILATIASAGGLFLDGLYRDNTFVTSLWGGNDLVTLVVAVPMLVAALILSRSRFIGSRLPGNLVNATNILDSHSSR
ncbi:MAG: hypothetical protein PVG32_09175 [Anaerolineales bacterium]